MISNNKQGHNNINDNNNNDNKTPTKTSTTTKSTTIAVASRGANQTFIKLLLAITKPNINSYKNKYHTNNINKNSILQQINLNIIGL